MAKSINQQLTNWNMIFYFIENLKRAEWNDKLKLTIWTIQKCFSVSSGYLGLLSHCIRHIVKTSNKAWNGLQVDGINVCQQSLIKITILFSLLIKILQLVLELSYLYEGLIAYIEIKNWCFTTVVWKLSDVFLFFCWRLQQNSK